MAEITLILGAPPYGRQRIYTALRLALASIYEGHSVNLFLLEDAVFAAKKGQNPQEMPGVLEGQMPNCGEMLKAAIAQGATVRVCGVCASERGISEGELVEGVEIGSMRELVRWTVESDKVLAL